MRAIACQVVEVNNLFKGVSVRNMTQRTKGETLSRVARVLIADVRMTLFHWPVNSVAGSPLVPRGLRVVIYRLMGIDSKSPNIYSNCTFTGRRVSIGQRTFINHKCYFESGRGSIEIGDNCLLAPAVMLLTSVHERDSEGVVSRSSTSLPVVVGDNVWLGARAMVLPGVSIGDGCVVGAGAVVTRDCAPGGVYVGVPAERVDQVHRAPR